MNILGLAQAPDEQPTAIRDQRQNTHDEDAIRLGELLSIVWRQKRVMVSIVAIIMILAIVIVSRITPMYTASTLVEINPRQTQVVNFDSVLTGLPSGNETLETEIKIIESRRIARRTIERLQLNQNPEFNPALRAEGLIASWRRSVADWLAAQAAAQQVDRQSETASEGNEEAGLVDRIMLSLAGAMNPTSEEDATDEERVTQEMDQTVDTFLKNLTVNPENTSRVIRISFESTDGKLSADIANTIADFYIVAQLEAKFDASKRATNWLNERVAQLRDEVLAKERAIEEYRTSSGLLQGDSQTTLTSEQVSELNTQHVLELARLAEAQARLRQTNELLKSPGGIDSAVDVLQSQLIQDLRKSETEVERRIAELSEEYGDRHPAMINARAELRDLRHKIQVEVDRIVQGLRNEVAIAKARATSLANSLNQVKAEVAKHNQAEVDLRSLERDANAARTLLETLMQRTKQTASQETFQEPDASIISYAAVPREQSYPMTGLSLSISFIGSLCLAVFFALVVEQLDAGFRSSEQIERQLGVPSLGVLPRLSMLAAMGASPSEYVIKHPESAYAEGIRTLFTNILLANVAERPKTILVSSALPGEGKTSVALSLARLMATVGHRVIVVDCDLRRPNIHKELGLGSGPGLVEYLYSEIPIEDVIDEDKASGAHFVRAGTLIHNSPGQLDSARMQKLIKTLSRKYDLVILDSAPLLAVSDTLFISRLADKTVLLIRWSQTRRAAVTLALKQLQNARAAVAGAMLTMADAKIHSQYEYGDANLYKGILKKYYTK